MSRKEFLERLDMLLCDIPDEEREEAIQYYEDYFDDAGQENEASVLEELESPEKVAAVVRSGMEPAKEEYSEYSETGYSDIRFEDKKVPETRGAASQNEEQKSKQYNEYYEEQKSDQYSGYSGEQKSDQYSGYGEKQKSGRYEGHRPEHHEEKKEPWTSDVLKVILIIAIIIVAIPIGGPILLGIVSLVFGLIVAFAGVFVGLVVAGFAIAISGIAVIGVGLAKMFTWQPGGIIMLGTGLILLALGVLLAVLMIKATGIVLPATFRGVVELIRKPFQRKNRGGA